jgi:signal transduction histidine kinase
MREGTLGIVAHELRSPLTTVLLGAQALLSKAFPADQREVQLRAILRSAESMKRLIDDLLDVYKFTYGQFTVQRSPVDIAALCLEIRDRLEPEAHERGVVLSYRVSPNLPQVFGDLDRLLQVLLNLVGNALKFTPGGGEVVIRAEAREDEVEISVEDTGPGIPSEKLPNVFERFWQGNRAPRSGAGLGLPIAKAIVVAHGGRIWAESILGAGTSVRFTIPVNTSPRTNSDG